MLYIVLCSIYVSPFYPPIDILWKSVTVWRITKVIRTTITVKHAQLVVNSYNLG